MNKPLLEELMRLDPMERLDIAVKLWDSVHPPGSALPGEHIPLTEEQMAEIDRRIAEHERNPERGRPWQAVMARLRARFDK
jgi:putative addiction module component (TIGR02574 family)